MLEIEKETLDRTMWRLW